MASFSGMRLCCLHIFWGCPSIYRNDKASTALKKHPSWPLSLSLSCRIHNGNQIRWHVTNFADLSQGHTARWPNAQQCDRSVVQVEPQPRLWRQLQRSAAAGKKIKSMIRLASTTSKKLSIKRQRQQQRRPRRISPCTCTENSV